MHIEMFSCPLRAAIEVAVKVGGLIAYGTWSSEMRLKPHPTFGTASVSEADIRSQAMTLAHLLDKFPSATFIAEEEGNARPGRHSDELCFSLDIVDGSMPYGRHLDRWCSAIGVMRSGIHHGGVVFAPEIRGGLTIAGERGNGVCLWEHSAAGSTRVAIEKLSSKPLIWLGVDVLQTNTYERFISALPKGLKPRGTAESGALGLALVAAGRVDAIVQSPQMPWDWCGGYPMVLEAGGAFQCFHFDGGRIIPVEKPTAVDYGSEKQMLGFIAGHPEIVPELFALLEANVV